MSKHRHILSFHSCLRRKYPEIYHFSLKSISNLWNPLGLLGPQTLHISAFQEWPAESATHPWQLLQHDAWDSRQVFSVISGAMHSAQNNKASKRLRQHDCRNSIKNCRIQLTEEMLPLIWSRWFWVYLGAITWSWRQWSPARAGALVLWQSFCNSLITAEPQPRPASHGEELTGH